MISAGPLGDRQSEVTTAKPVVNGDHGRIDIRAATVSDSISWLQESHQWSSLAVIGKVVHSRESAIQTTTETA